MTSSALSLRNWPRIGLSPATLAGLAVIGVVVSYGVAMQPWLFTGIVFGAIVLVVAISAPLALLAFSLVLGGVDLSFMTGGFKALFPQFGGLDMNGIRLVGASVGFMAFIMNAPAARSAILGKHGRFYFIFLAAALLTIPTSFDPLDGVRMLLKLAYPFLMFLLVIGLCDTEEKLERLSTYALVAAALIMFVINPLFILQDGGIRVDIFGYTRLRGVAAHENAFSFYMMILLFFAFTRLIFRKQLRYLFFCIAAAAWITLTMTRITWLAVIVGVFAITVATSAAQRQYRALIAGIVITLVVALPGLPFILERSLGFVPTPGELFTLITHPQALYESINWQGRTRLWPIVWMGFMASPVIGLGLGSSGVVIAQHFPAEAANVAHNEYLRLAADLGVVGVALFTVAMLVWLVSMIAASLRRNQKVAEYAIPALAGIIGWSIIAITDNPFDAYMAYTQYVGFLVGATIAMQAITAKSQ